MSLMSTTPLCLLSDLALYWRSRTQFGYSATEEAKCRVYQARKQSFPAAEHLAYADIELHLHVHVSMSGFVLVQQYHSSKLK